LILDQHGLPIRSNPPFGWWGSSGVDIPKVELGAEQSRKEREAIIFSIDFPYQVVTIKRAKGWRLWLLRIRNAPYDLYFAIRSRLQPSWLDE
jgi:hypothetical protein